jgi:PAS domain S-box-containing protein
MSTLRLQRAFLARIGPESPFHLLFDALPDVCMFAKDVDGRLWVVNRALLRRFGFQGELELIGKTDFDLLPRSLAEKYRADDLEIMATGKPMSDVVELFLDSTGIATWHLTNKLPIFSRQRRILGVMGTIVGYESRAHLGVSRQGLLRAFEAIRRNCARRISIRTLASQCGISVRQFERRCREQLRVAPRELIMKMRVHRACDQLRETRDPIAEVALACGFYDQAALTRQFHKHVGLTPGQYRRRFG